MLTTSDKKYISSEVTEQIDKALKKNNEVLIKEIVELFDTTNERIDKVLEKLDDHQGDINSHERRITKLEDKVFAS